jgi:hypothetical protein
MKFAAWYGILVGVLIIVQWGSFLATGQVPELRAEPLRIAFHLAGEGLMAIGLFISGIALLKRKSWAKRVYFGGVRNVDLLGDCQPGIFRATGSVANGRNV